MNNCHELGAAHSGRFLSLGVPMRKFNIFLASSTEQLSFASKIADALSKLGHMPIRWWTSFDASTYNLEALEEVLEKADAGVFVCFGDDQATVRKNHQKIPRDNVILELGFFLSALGRRRCFVVAPSDNQLRLPTDLAGLTTIHAAADPDSIASMVINGILKSLDGENRYAKNNCINIRADPEITAKINSTPTPVEWHQRALYCGTEGGKAWLAYADDEFNNVQTSNDRDLDREKTLAALDDVGWRSFISLGPGDARRDRHIYDKLQTLEVIVQYVPVDISEGLIHHAARTLGLGGALVPFGILGDFEDGQDFVFEHLNHSLPRPWLIGLLGNTLGNLDVGAETFLRRIAVRMQPGDELLLDIATTQVQWDFDPYHRYFQSPVRRQFIAQGIARQLGQSAEKILSRFESRVAAKRIQAPDHAEQQLIYDQETGKLGLTLRAYYFDKFCAWITKELPFDLKWGDDYQFEGTSFGAGLIRLARR